MIKPALKKGRTKMLRMQLSALRLMRDDKSMFDKQADFLKIYLSFAMIKSYYYTNSSIMRGQQ